jgi:hypothetical protein
LDIQHPNSPYSLPSNHFHSITDGLYLRYQSATQENDKKRHKEKTTGEADLVDIAYPIFKKWKEKIDKIEEMRNYIAKTISFPLSSRYIQLWQT